MTVAAVMVFINGALLWRGMVTVPFHMDDTHDLARGIRMGFEMVGVFIWSVGLLILSAIDARGDE